jgi:hypothetical protein
MKPEAYLRSTNYGVQKETHDLVIYVPHGESRPAMIKHFHDKFKDFSPLSLENFSRYCDFDADIGSPEIGHQMGTHLAESTELSVLILEILIPRVVVDVNRYENAIHPLFHFCEGSAVYQAFKSLHLGLIQSTWDIMTAAKFSLHLHTMASHNSSGQVPKDPEELETKIDKICQETYNGDLRTVNFVNNTEDGICRGDKALTKIFKTKFETHNIQTSENDPFKLFNNFPCTELLIESSGLIVDIPKSIIATPQTTKLKDPSQIELDEKQVSFLSEILAKGVKERLNKFDK